MTQTAPRATDMITARPWTATDVWPDRPHAIAYVILGLFVGMASALLGIGGGILIVPILSGFLGVPLRKAIAISIVSVFGVATMGVAGELVARTDIPWLVVLVLAIGAQGGVWIGGKVGRKIPENVLRYIFAAIILLTATKLAGFVALGSPEGAFPLDSLLAWLPWVLVLGVLAGFLSVLIGVGGGIVVVPGLVFLVAGIAFRAVQATSLAMIIPTAFSGTIVHIRQKNVLWRSVTLIVLPGLLGAVVGVYVANNIQPELLETVIFPIFLLIMAIRLTTQKPKGR